MVKLVNRLACLGVALVSVTAYAGKPADEINKLVDLQIQGWSKDVDQSPDEDALYAGATFTVTGNAANEDHADVNPGDLVRDVVASMGIIDRRLTNRAVTIAHDGKSAWVSFDIWMKVDNSADGERMIFERDFRVTEIAVATKDGWRFVGGTWTSAQDNAQINKEARAGKPRKLAELPKKSESKTLLDAFTAMLAASSPTTAKDLVAIGSASGERTVGGAAFARAWDAAWRARRRRASLTGIDRSGSSDRPDVALI